MTFNDVRDGITFVVSLMQVVYLCVMPVQLLVVTQEFLFCTE